MTGYQHILTQISSKHRVFLQLTWCISEFMTLPKRVEFCAGSRHIWGSPNVTFPKALTWKIAWRGLRPPLVAQEIIARTTGIMSVSATPEPFLTAGSKGKMSSSKLFSPIYCRDFSRTMSPFCFNVCCKSDLAWPRTACLPWPPFATCHYWSWFVSIWEHHVASKATAWHFFATFLSTDGLWWTGSWGDLRRCQSQGATAARHFWRPNLPQRHRRVKG